MTFFGCVYITFDEQELVWNKLDLDGKELGCISLGKIRIQILNPKMDFSFLWENPKLRDYESYGSTLDRDSMD